jgi:hypothetical protein
MTLWCGIDGIVWVSTPSGFVCLCLKFGSALAGSWISWSIMMIHDNIILYFTQLAACPGGSIKLARESWPGNLKEYAALVFISSPNPSSLTPLSKDHSAWSKRNSWNLAKWLLLLLHCCASIASFLVQGACFEVDCLPGQWIRIDCWSTLVRLSWDSHGLSYFAVVFCRVFAAGLGFEVCYWKFFQWRQCSSTPVRLSLLLPDSETLRPGRGRDGRGKFRVRSQLSHNNPFMLHQTGIRLACASCLYNLHWLSKVIFSNSGRIFSGRPTRTVFTSCRQIERKSISLQWKVRTVALQIWPVGETHPRHSILGQSGLGSQLLAGFV